MAIRRKFSAEFKREAVGLAQSSDQSVSQVARDLGVSPNVLTRWVREGRPTDPRVPGARQPP